MRYLITLIALFAAIPFSFSQNSWSHIYGNMTVNDVVEVQNNLWVASDIGLFKIDKTTLQSTHYTTLNSALPHNHIQTLSKDQFNNLWIGTYELFLVKIDNSGNPWMVINLPDSIQGVSLANNKTYSSVVDNNGTVWLSSQLGLLSYDGNYWELAQYNQNFGMIYPLWDLCINSNGDINLGSHNLLSYNKTTNTFTEHLSPFTTNNIIAYGDARMLQQNDSSFFFFADHGGVNKIQNGNWETWGVLGSALPIDPRSDKLSLCMHNNGSLYYNTYSNLLVRYDGTQWLVDSSFAQQNSTISSIEYFYISDNGDFWLFQDNLFEKSTSMGLTAGSLISLVDFNFDSKVVVDNSGTPYLTAYFKGIQQYNQGSWTLIPGSNNFANQVTAFDNNNKAWFISRDANYNPTIVEQTATGWNVHDNTSTGGLFPASPSTSNIYYFYDLAINNNNTVFVTDELDKIYKYENGSWSIIYNPSNASNIYISSLVADNNGNIWWVERLTISLGVYSSTLKKYDGTNIQSYTTGNGPSLQKPYIDANGHIWVSLSAGQLNEFDGTTWTTHNLPINAFVNNITGRNNHLYVGTSSNGLLEFDGNNWTNFTLSNSPLSNNDVRDLTLDADGNLWLTNVAGQIIDIYDSGMLLNPTSKLETSKEIVLNLYPNPTQHFIQLETTLSDIQSIQVVNPMGQIVIELSTNKVQKIDVSGITAGLYWVLITTNTKQENVSFMKY